jgi:hypothetical protein
VKDLKAVADATGAVYIMVVNESATSPYTGARAEPINLKVERKEDFLKRLQKNNNLDIRVVGDCQYSNTLGASYTRVGGGSWGFSTITWSGTDFYSAHETLNPGRDDYYIEGSVDPVNKTITCSYTYFYQSQTNASRDDSSFTITNMPVYPGESLGGYPYDYYPRIANTVWAGDCLLYLTAIDAHGFCDEPDPGPPPDWSWSTTGYTFTEGPPNGDYIVLRFLKDWY